jgi:hypothetical protein
MCKEVSVHVYMYHAYDIHFVELVQTEEATQRGLYRLTTRSIY